MISPYKDSEMFDTMITYSDWRYSATAVGLSRFFEQEGINYMKGEDYLAYKREDVTGEGSEEKYLRFAERYFSGKMHHLVIKDLLIKDELSDDQEKLLNEKLKANVVIKKVFGKEKYSVDNRDNLLKLLEENRLNIIRETYKNGMSCYRNFCNVNSFREESKEICRLVGYYVDLPKKKKSIAYYWDYDTFVYSDEPEFDYIPFAFTRTSESFFINNNYNTKELLKSNNKLNEILEDNDSPRQVLFLSTQNSVQFIDYDVEVILKEREHDYFETLYVRKSTISIFKQMSKALDAGDKNMVLAITNPCRVGRDEFLDLKVIIIDRILNGIYLDDIIEGLLKDSNKHGFRISQLTRINQMIYEEDGSMEFNSYDVRKTASLVVNRIQSNKVTSYRNRLISCLTFKDYDRFKTVLLQLSAYSGVTFSFAYALFDNFEENKNIAYTFVNALEKIETIK